MLNYFSLNTFLFTEGGRATE